MRSSFACLLLVPLLAHAQPPRHMWFTVLLDGRKIGSFENRREIVHENGADRVVTTQKLDLVLERAGVGIALGTEETSEESLAGEPVAFSSVSRLSGTETRIEGEVRDGRITVTTRNGGPAQRSRMAWPSGALLPEGLRLAGMRAGLKPGTRYRALAFQPSDLDAIPIDTVVGATELVDLPTGPKWLSVIDQTLVFPGAPAQSRAWVSADQTVHKLVMPLLGVDLTLLACDRVCAQAPNQDSDIFARTLMPAPRALTTAERAQGLRYVLVPRDGGAALELPDTDEQRVRKDGRNLIVTVRASASPGAEPAPTAADYAATDWLQSGAPEIIGLAHKAVGDASTSLARMQRLQTFVQGYIENKNLGVGYASALEVARQPSGDCTEHAVLLAALGRSLGIATRVVDGLAYAPGFAGIEQMFVPHAWVQAWIDGRWQSFDAALDGFDAGHIALSVGDGDPWRFYAGLGALGRVDLHRVDPVAPTGAAPVAVDSR